MTVILEALIAATLLVSIYALIFARWQRGLYWLIAYLPFAGTVTMALSQWPPSLLFKDILFIIPLYLAFFARLCLGREILADFPKPIAFLMLSLAALVILQAANPGVANAMVALIGLKVWLLYLPLCFIAYAFFESSEAVIGLLRLLVGLSFIPASVALIEVCLTLDFGYHDSMQMVYGEQAFQATQRFASFEVGSGILGRIPSTFTFVAQFFGYSLAMLVPAYIVWRADPSRRWRRTGGMSLVLAALSTLISGSRAAYVFTPLTLALMFLLDEGLGGLIASMTAVTSLIWAVVVTIFGIALWQMYTLVSDLLRGYAQEVAYGGLMMAIASAPFGMGTGTNTGAARYAADNPGAFHAIENYYAKAAYELGIPGLLIVAGLFVAIIVSGLKERSRMIHPAARSCADALVAFFITMLVNSLKGWQIDLDPINVYYWLFAGLLLKLPVLEMHILAGQAGVITPDLEGGFTATNEAGNETADHGG